MFEYYVRGLLSIAIWFIAFFIAMYSFMFLMKTTEHRERRPWDFLFVASVVFLVFETLSVLIHFGIIALVKIDIIFWSKIFEFLYSGFVLLAYVSQHDLILKNHLILISKKDENPSLKKQVEEEVEKKIQPKKKVVSNKKH